MISNKFPHLDRTVKGNCKTERKWLTQGCKSTLYSCNRKKGFYSEILFFVEL